MSKKAAKKQVKKRVKRRGGKMYCYLWWDRARPNECKFGERFVFTGQDPYKEIMKRIRDQLKTSKYIWDKGDIVVESYWDVSKWALDVGRNYVGGHMDDFIRELVGHRQGSTGEFHNLTGPEMAGMVNVKIQKTSQPLPVAGLAQWQYDDAVDAIIAIDAGKKVIMAELCARFGKTIWAGVLAVETNTPLTIVASYVLTSFFSFKKDLTGFEQFRNLVVVDSASPTYLKEVKDALKDGKQVVVFLSMCGGSNRQARIDNLFNIRKTRLLIVDEADFGVHRPGQTDPLIAALKKNDMAILMTGTNGERACGNWKIDGYLGRTYPELLVAKAEAA